MRTADTPLNLEGLAPIVGLRIREARTDKAMSQKDLVGERFSKSYISSIERGKITPSLKALEYIARQLSVSVAYLLTGMHPNLDGATPSLLGGSADDTSEQDSPARWELLLTEVGLLREQGQHEQALHILNSRVRVRQLGVEQLKQYHLTLAQLYFDDKDIAETQAELEIVRDLADKTEDQETLARTRHMVGLIYTQQNKPVQAIEQLRLALRAVEAGTIKDFHFRLALYSQLGTLHHQLGDDNEAAEMYRQALQLAEDTANPEKLAGLYWNMAQNYRESSNFLQAKTYANKSLALYESLADRRALTELRAGYGVIMLETHNFGEAEQQFRLAHQSASDGGDTTAGTIASMHLADLYMERNDLPEAERYSKEMEQGINQLGPVEKAQALSSRANLMATQGNNVGALEMYKEAVKLIEETGLAKELLSKIYFRYARALSATGDTAHAAEMFEQAYRQLDRSTLVGDLR